MKAKYFLWMFVFMFCLDFSLALNTSNNLVYWSFDRNSTVADYGNRTLINSNTLYNSTGKLGGAREFLQSNNAYLYLNNVSDLNFGSSNWSVNLWVRQKGRASTGDYQLRWSKGSNDLGQGFEHFGSLGSATAVKWQESNTIDGNDGNLQSSDLVNFNDWNMVTYTWTANTLKLYINGVLNVSDVSTSSWYSATYDFMIGSGANVGVSARTYMNGSIDEFSVWSKTLNDSEISELYNGGSGYNPFGTKHDVEIYFDSNTPSSGSTVSSLYIGVTLAGNETLNDTRRIYLYTSTGSLINSTLNLTSVNWTTLSPAIYYFNASVNLSNGSLSWTDTRFVSLASVPVNLSIYNAISGLRIDSFNVIVSDLNASTFQSVSTSSGSVLFSAVTGDLINLTIIPAEGDYVSRIVYYVFNVSTLLNLSVSPNNAGKVYLIYEGNNTYYNCNAGGVYNLTSCKLYLGDSNTTLFNFKSNNTNNVSFDLGVQTKFRVELVYPSGDIITRFFDIGVVPDKDNIRVCVNPINVTHYEMIAYSASQRGVSLVNPFANCLVGSDDTRFAYQDAFILRTLTIDMPYYLYTVSGGVQTFLVGIDGSVESFINVDTLEFRSQAFDVVLTSDSLTVFNNQSINTSVIRYFNSALDNSLANVSIINSDSTVILDSGFLFNPNNFTVLFDYTLVNTSVSSLFEIKFCFTDVDGDSDCDSYYLDTTSGLSGNGVSSPLAMMIAIVMVIVGFTLTQSKLSFSWFGLICLFIALVVLAFSPITWYTKAFMGLIAIYIVFIAFIMPSKAKDTILG